VSSGKVWHDLCEKSAHGDMAVERVCIRNKDGDLVGTCKSWHSQHLSSVQSTNADYQESLWKYAYLEEESKLSSARCIQNWYTLGIPLCNKLRFCVLHCKPESSVLSFISWTWLVAVIIFFLCSAGNWWLASRFPRHSRILLASRGDTTLWRWTTSLGLHRRRQPRCPAALLQTERK